MAGPLEGVRVADFSRVLAGPYATMMLGDLGADVIKIERPESGDETRGWGPPFAGGESTYYLAVNRNKRSVTLDLTRPDHLDAARAIVASSAILVENFRPGTMSRLGLGYDEIRAINPAIVYCSVSGFGIDGDAADRPGYDFVIQGEGGLMSITGEPDGPAEKVGVAVSDITAGLFATISILSALRSAEASGQGQQVHVSLYASQLAWLANQGSSWLAAGVEPRRMGNAHPNIVPYQVFDAADAPLVVAVANEALWGRFCRALHESGAHAADRLEVDPRFARNADRVAHRDELVAILRGVFACRSRAEWLALLAAAAVPAGPINSISEVFASPLGAARVETIQHPTVGDLPLVRSPLDLFDTPATLRRPPPLLGEHTANVLAEVGYASDAIAEMLR